MDLWSQLPVAWQKALTEVKDSIDQISKTLSTEKSINPKPEMIFRALGNSPDQFRVIIVGQDPYPNKNHAMGLAFCVPAGEKVPVSLGNIYKELASDVGATNATDLISWSQNGVLLINRILTCKTGESLSHANLGWQVVSAEIIKAVIQVNPNTIGILWGKYAQEVSELFNPNLLVMSPHPSGLSAYRGFFGSKPFSRANKLLTETNQLPINWA